MSNIPVEVLTELMMFLERNEVEKSQLVSKLWNLSIKENKKIDVKRRLYTLRAYCPYYTEDPNLFSFDVVGQNQIRKSSHWFYDKYLDVLLNSYALNLQIVDRIIIKDPKDIKIIEMEFAKKEFDDKKKMNISKLLRKRKVPYFCLVEWKYFPPVNAPPLMSTIFDNMNRMFESIDFDIPDKRNNCLDFEDLNITFDKDISDIVFSDELQCVTMHRPLQKSPILFFPYIVLFSAMLFFE